MIPTAKSMDLKDTKWYIPRAPYKADSGSGYTWFSGSNEKGWKYKKTFSLMEKLLKQVMNDGFSANNIYMIGFSMGAGLCYQVALRLEFSIGGIIPIAGFIRNPERLFNDTTDISRQTPILILHGTEDEIISVERGLEAHDLLNEHGYCVRMETYKATHKIPLRAGAFIKDFINDNEFYLSAEMESK